MKRIIYSTALAVWAAGGCLANDVPSLTIHKSDGEKLVVALDDIIVMELGQTPTAIHSLLSHPAPTYVITDLQGHLVSKGKAESITWPTQQGVYIISVGDKSKKLFVK